MKLIPELKLGTAQNGHYRRYADDFSAENATAFAQLLESVGAESIVVNTNKINFGSISWINPIKRNTKLKIIVRDFILFKHQIEEIRLYGAEALIIPVFFVNQPLLSELVEYSKNCGLEVFLEVRAGNEISKLQNISCAGVVLNNEGFDGNYRYNRSIVLYEQIPSRFHRLISYEGISNTTAIKSLKALGFTDVVLGESLMESPNPGAFYKVLNNFK